MESPNKTATDDYYDALEDWERDKERLAFLEGQTRITPSETLEKLTLQQNNPHKWEDAEALRLAMESQLLTVYVTKAVTTWNVWTTPQAEAFGELVAAMRNVFHKRDNFVRVHDQQIAAMAQEPGAEQVALKVPTGREALQNLVPLDVANAHVWTPLLLSSEEATMPPKDIAKMWAGHKAAQPKDVRHVLQETLRRRNQR